MGRSVIARLAHALATSGDLQRLSSPSVSLWPPFVACPWAVPVPTTSPKVDAFENPLDPKSKTASSLKIVLLITVSSHEGVLRSAVASPQMSSTTDQAAEALLYYATAARSATCGMGSVHGRERLLAQLLPHRVVPHDVAVYVGRQRWIPGPEQWLNLRRAKTGGPWAHAAQGRIAAPVKAAAVVHGFVDCRPWVAMRDPRCITMHSAIEISTEMAAALADFEYTVEGLCLVDNRLHGVRTHMALVDHPCTFAAMSASDPDGLRQLYNTVGRAPRGIADERLVSIEQRLQSSTAAPRTELLAVPSLRSACLNPSLFPEARMPALTALRILQMDWSTDRRWMDAWRSAPHASSTFPALTSVDVSGTIPPEFVSVGLASAPRLQTVTLSGALTEAVVEALGCLVALTSLHLQVDCRSDFSLTHNGARALSQLVHLRSLKLERVTSLECLSFLPALTVLRVLSIEAATVSPSVFAHLRYVQQLTDLSVTVTVEAGAGDTVATIRDAVSTICGLRRLVLYLPVPLDGTSLCAMCRLPVLEDLSVGLSQGRSFSGRSRLAVQPPPVAPADDALATAIASAAQLKSLTLSRVTLTPDTLAAVGSLRTLTSLSLLQCAGLADVGVSALVGPDSAPGGHHHHQPCSSLRKLDIFNAPPVLEFTDRALSLLATLPRMESLDVLGVGTTSAGAEQYARDADPRGLRRLQLPMAVTTATEIRRLLPSTLVLCGRLDT